MGIASGNPTWENLPSEETPLSAGALNNIEDALDTTQGVATSAEASANTALDATTTGRLSQNSLDARYTVYRGWTGTAYPPRIPGALNIFFGPVDPGLAMEGEDYWANPEVATIGDVIDAINAEQSVSAMFAGAGSLSVIGNDSAAEATGRAGILEQYGSTAGGIGSTPGRVMPDAGSTRLGEVISVPPHWTAVKFRVHWVHKVNALTGAVRFQVTANPVGEGTLLSAPLEYNVSISPSAGAHLAVKVSDVGIYPVTGTGLMRVAIGRNSGHANDTFAGDVGLIGLEIVRVN